MKSSRNKRKHTPVARRLRRDATDAERRLWLHLRNAQLAGHKFRRQLPIGPYIADFACYDQKLVIEVDGGQHADNAQDRSRESDLNKMGFRVLRFWNNDVLTNTEGVLDKILEALQSSHPSPAR